MKLKRFLLRYHPPGIILEYLRKNGEIETKSIDLLNLTPEYVLLTNLRFDGLPYFVI
jgi:hypothetical protein